MNEFAVIEAIKKMQGTKVKARIGIGDDAAWVAASPKGSLISTDMMVDGVDFLLKKHAPERIGHKALAINLSDLAAMGAKPENFVISLGIPTAADEKWILRFYRGLFKLAKKYGVECVGGDFSRADQLFISVTLLGHPASKRPVLRSGARPGDWIGVTGSLGGSILKKHLDFDPRVNEGVFLVENKCVHAMIDISDGFVQDLEHLLCMSGVSADIDLSQVPVAKDAFKGIKGGTQAALMRALSDGEDFELLFTASEKQKAALERLWRRKFPQTRLSWVGQCRKGKGGIQWYNQGQPQPKFKINKKGFNHFL